jgi:uncharacterized protein YfaT (DUF1175 family)
VITRSGGAFLACASGAVALVGLLLAGRGPAVPPHVSILSAEGGGTTLAIDAPESAGRPRIVVETPHTATIDEPTFTDNQWQATVHPGGLPGRILLRVEFPALPPATVEFTTALNPADSYQDGTPDFLRLDDSQDRSNFRRWFAWLAEAQYFQPPASRPPEINDCAALIRYAYRETLRAHESGWAEAARVPVVPAIKLIVKYQYPYTPLGAALFRVQPGPFRPTDLNGPAFAQFADAQSLWRFNTHPVSRDLAQALPGDLLFFRHEGGRMPFHSMIYLGPSQVRPDAHRYLLYHTGPEGDDPGEIRRLTVVELLRYPQPEWRPAATNPGFLGVYRWNILREAFADDAH